MNAKIQGETMTLDKEAIAKLGEWTLGVRNWIGAAQSCLEAP